LDSKLDKITDWPALKTYRDLGRGLGLSNYLKKFIPHYSELVTPLVEKLKTINKQISKRNSHKIIVE
jgi:hypothetical protein